MFRLANIFLFFALVTSVFGSAVFKPKQCGKYSTINQVKLLRSQFKQPAVFCNWYLGRRRLQSPNNKFTTAQFTAACECLVQKHASTKKTVKKAPYNFKRVCKPAQKEILIKHFQNPKFPKQKGQPKVFCDFWGKAKQIYRSNSPFNGMTNQQVYNACECYYHPITTTAAYTTPATTTSATTVSVATTSATTTAPVVITTGSSNSSSSSSSTISSTTSSSTTTTATTTSTTTTSFTTTATSTSTSTSTSTTTSTA